MGKSEEDLLGLPPVPSGYKLVTSQVSTTPEVPRDLPPIPEGYKLITPQVPKIPGPMEESINNITQQIISRGYIDPETNLPYTEEQARELAKIHLKKK